MLHAARHIVYKGAECGVADVTTGFAAEAERKLPIAVLQRRDAICCGCFCSRKICIRASGKLFGRYVAKF